MRDVFCTLFDSNYLDKGLALYESMEKCMAHFTLYILPMNDQCENVLRTLNLSNVKIIDTGRFFDENLRKLRTERGIAEFSWTCTSHLIQYILENEPVESCTYIDSDIFFYKSPYPLIEAMRESRKSVLIVPHWFSNKPWDVKAERNSGRFCVEFNTFFNDDSARAVLTEWISDCDNCCVFGGDGINCGDQKYLEKWPGKYDTVQICTDRGAGIAPWNLFQYRYEHNDVVHVLTNEKIEPVFFHFQNLEFLDKDHVNINVYRLRGAHQEKIVNYFYMPYLRTIYLKRQLLQNRFGIVYIKWENHGRRKSEDNLLNKLISKIKSDGFIETIKFVVYRRNDIFCLSERIKMYDNAK